MWQGDEVTDHFLHILLDLAVQHCLSSGEQEAARYPGAQPPLKFIVVDAFVRLLCTLVSGLPSRCSMHPARPVGLL